MAILSFLATVLVTAVYAVPNNPLMQESRTLTDLCFPPRLCNVFDSYRTLDGRCNNLNFPNWGITDGYYLQLVIEKTSDEIDTNPNVRVLRKTLLPDIENDEEDLSQKITVLVPSFGQIMAHDTALTIPKKSAGSCCANSGTEAVANKTCAAFSIPSDDPHYSTCGKTCESLVRSKTSKDEGCLIPVHQRNNVTDFLDLSNLYGNDATTAKSLRSFSGGELKSRTVNGAEFCPTQSPANVCTPNCGTCYLTGDARQVQNLVLTVIHHIFFRFHNSISRDLAKLNPKWNDERLYQEARKITIAVYQKIAYYDWLPHVLGPEEASKFADKNNKEYSQYNSQTHPNTFMEFNFCYRQFHSLVRDTVELFDNSGKRTNELVQYEHFNCPAAIEEGNNLDEIAYGSTLQAAHTFGQGVVDSLGNKLFKGETNPCGSDLSSIDNDRFRDDRQKNYCELLKDVYGTSDCESVKEALHSEESLEKLEKAYQNKDIEALYGTYLEKPGFLLGETCQKLISLQFRNWKVGDRFYYENPPWFTEDQLKSIQGVTFGSLLCSQTNISKVAEDVFEVVSEQNKEVECSSVSGIDLNLWKDDLETFSGAIDGAEAAAYGLAESANFG